VQQVVGETGVVIRATIYSRGRDKVENPTGREEMKDSLGKGIDEAYEQIQARSMRMMAAGTKESPGVVMD
jgi:hypothetical protein